VKEALDLSQDGLLDEASLDIWLPSKGRGVKCVEVVVTCNTLVSQCRCVESHGGQNTARQLDETEVYHLQKIFISFSKESAKTMLARETFYYKTN
jgi:hypothetical protein